MKARLVFRPYYNEIESIETEWVKFDNLVNFEAIQLYMRNNYCYLLSSAIEKLGFIHDENVAKEIISQILNNQGEVKIEFKDKTLNLEGPMYRVVDSMANSYLIAEVRTYDEAIKAAQEYHCEVDGNCEIDIIDIEDSEEINY